MNEEMSKIKKENDDNSTSHKPVRLSEERMNELMYELNSNLATLYSNSKKDDIDTNEFAKIFANNVQIVLKMFDEMGIYPDYFYDEIVKMNIEYKKIDSNTSLRGNYRLFNEINLSSRVAKAIKSGLDKGYYLKNNYPNKDINDSFLEMISFFQVFNIPYGVNTIEQCKKSFNDIWYNHQNIMDTLANSDYIFVDIECLARLLFEYMTFFVSVGIHPSRYLGETDLIEQTKRK